MSILVTGAHGMVARAVIAVLERDGYHVVEADRTFCDITDTPTTLRLLREMRPTAVFHCAAYTDVDGAEVHEDAAYRVNALGALNVAAGCAEAGAWMVHLSSDYVFGGDGGAPYDEFAAVSPRGVYARTKEAGERLVRETLPDRHLILRTAYVLGDGPNLVRTILRLAGERERLSFVADQRISPTHTADLALTAVALLENPLPGTYHVASAGDDATPYALARHVVERRGLSTAIDAVTLAQYAAEAGPKLEAAGRRLAPRPQDSRLARRMLAMRGMDTMPAWRDAVDAYLATL